MVSRPETLPLRPKNISHISIINHKESVYLDEIFSIVVSSLIRFLNCEEMNENKGGNAICWSNMIRVLCLCK